MKYMYVTDNSEGNSIPHLKWWSKSPTYAPSNFGARRGIKAVQET